MGNRQTGFTRANTSAVSSSNYGKSHSKKGEKDYAFGEDYYSGAIDTHVSGIKVKRTPDATEETLTFSAPVVLADLEAELEKAMFAVVNDFIYDFNIEITEDSGSVVFKHQGQAIITNLIDNAGDQATTRKPKKAHVSDWTFVHSSGEIVMTNEETGVETTIAGGPYNHSGTEATDDATAATVKTNLEAYFTAEGLDSIVSTPAQVAADTDWIFTVTVNNGARYLVAGAAMTYVGNEQKLYFAGTANDYRYDEL